MLCSSRGQTQVKAFCLASVGTIYDTRASEAIFKEAVFYPLPQLVSRLRMYLFIRVLLSAFNSVRRSHKFRVSKGPTCRRSGEQRQTTSSGSGPEEVPLRHQLYTNSIHRRVVPRSTTKTTTKVTNKYPII